MTPFTPQPQQHGDNYSNKSSYKPVSSVSSGLGGGGFTIFSDANDDAINSDNEHIGSSAYSRYTLQYYYCCYCYNCCSC
jgi:hypothetical protein